MSNGSASYGAHSDAPSRNVGTIERIGSVATGAALIGYAIAQRRKWLAVAATQLVYRGLTGRCSVYSGLGWTTAGDVSDTRVALSGDRGSHVRESIRLEAPVENLYRFWRRLENLPRFIAHLERVTETGGGRSHWVAKGPAGFKVEWDAEIINDEPNRIIAWRSLAGADVVTAGSVTFDAVRGGRSSQISVHLQYAAPAGRLGSAIAALFGAEPSQTIREDLRRLKCLVEAGEIPVAAAPARRRSSK